MKYTLLFYILVCVAYSLFTACEKSNLQNEQSLQTTLQYRGDCQACPEDDECCCAVRLQQGAASAMLQICGSTSGTSTCFKSGCGGFTGITYSFTLSGSQVQEFCALISGPFWIKNVGMVDAEIIITCQNGETSPQEIQITLGPTDDRYFENNGSCEIGPC